MKNKLIFITILITFILSALVFLVPAAELEEIKHTNYQLQANNLELLLNNYREENNLPALQVNETLRKTAQEKAIELCNSNKFEHERPDGSTFDTIFTKEKQSKAFKMFGENLARKFKSDEGTMNGWKKSDGHNKNMLKNWSHVGISTIHCENDGFIYSVQHFARIK